MMTASPPLMDKSTNFFLPWLFVRHKLEGDQSKD